MTKFVRLIDQKRCMGCRACLAACATENYFTPDAQWNSMLEYEVGTYPSVKKIYNTLGCMHCERPSCKVACDSVGAKAISKNQFGVVLIDYNKCIGCGYCMAVCPYGVPHLNREVNALYPGKGKNGAENIAHADRHPTHRKKAKTAEKCTFCTHKLEQAVADGKTDRIGKDQAYTPACDIVCPTQARVFGDIDDPNSEVSKRIKATGATQLRKHFGNHPQVYYALDEGAKS
jgi:Fe-S-cluster-containing dehydrogenase component